MAARCDFCSGGPVRWEYPAKNFDHPHLVAESIGAWAACNPCRQLIEENDREGLTRSSWESMLAKNPNLKKDQQTYLLVIDTIHRQFFAARTGGGRPWTE